MPYIKKTSIRLKFFSSGYGFSVKFKLIVIAIRMSIFMQTYN